MTQPATTDIAPTAVVHPYFTAKARAVLSQAGGDPENAGPLAAWAHQARTSDGSGGDSRAGVIVAEDGEVIARTRHHHGGPDTAGGTYVVDDDTARWGLVTDELGLALGQLAHKTGRPLIHVKFWQVCTGASLHTPDTGGPRESQ